MSVLRYIAWPTLMFTLNITNIHTYDTTEQWLSNKYTKQVLIHLILAAYF